MKQKYIRQPMYPNAADRRRGFVLHGASDDHGVGINPFLRFLHRGSPDP